MLKQFDKHSAKWAKLCRERGLSKEESMRWGSQCQTISIAIIRAGLAKQIIWFKCLCRNAQRLKFVCQLDARTIAPCLATTKIQIFTRFVRSLAYVSTKCVAKQWSDSWWFIIIMSYQVTVSVSCFCHFILCPISISGNGILHFCVTGVVLQPYEVGSHATHCIFMLKAVSVNKYLHGWGAGERQFVLWCSRDAKKGGLLRLCLVTVHMSFTRACCYQTSKHK